MKFKHIILLIFILLSGIAAARENADLTAGKAISANAIWGPGMEMMHAIHDSCDNTKAPSFGDCFVEQMKNMGASPEAVEFAKLTGNQGFMRDFKETGKVDVAFAVYPFRANENQVCFLVNGTPNMIDIDDYDYISKINLKKNKVYNQIFKKYPNVSIWPGDRSGTEYPVTRKLPDGGQQFIINYRLQDGCHACTLIGLADLAFNFDRNGKFTGITIIDVLKLQASTKESVIQGEYANPGKTIKIKAGQPFTIALKSNATTGYQWRIADTLNENIVYKTGEIYLPPQNSIPGAGGKEEWNFIGNHTGTTDIIFKYIRSWEKSVKPSK
ncbi:MAG: protease inhibitor I42 family protein, partial [Ignavibacteriaceae bacterium]|nr:protease inhibitor I42 family protein [Ignavibacteriaceae bacterium]